MKFTKKVFTPLLVAAPLMVLPVATIVSCGGGGEQNQGGEQNLPKPPIVSQTNPGEILPDLKEFNNYNEFIKYINKKPILSTETVKEIEKFNEGVNTPTTPKPFGFADFRIFWDQIYNELNGNIDEIKKNAVNVPLSPGYDFVIKNRFSILPQDSNNTLLCVLVQLTKDGQEILGADFNIALNNYKIVDVPKSAFNLINNNDQKQRKSRNLLLNLFSSIANPNISRAESLIEWKEMVNNIINLVKKNVEDSPEEYNKTHFSLFEWNVRQILGINNNEFSAASFFYNIMGQGGRLSTSIHGNINANNNINIKNMLAERVAKFWMFDEKNNNALIIQDSTIVNKALFLEFLNILRETTLSAIDSAFDKNKPEWWYINFFELFKKSEKNRTFFQKYDDLVNFLRSRLITKASKPIYNLKPEEVDEPNPPLPSNIVIKKSDLENLLNLNVSSLWDEKQNNWSNNLKLFSDFLTPIPIFDEKTKDTHFWNVSKIDLANNTITYANEGQSMFPNLFALKSLSKYNLDGSELKVNEIINFENKLFERHFRIPSLNDSNKVYKTIKVELRILNDDEFNKSYVSDGNFIVERSTGKLIRCNYLVDQQNVVIPDQIEGVDIKEIGTRAFQGDYSIGDYSIRINSLKLPSKLERIDDYAFAKLKMDGIRLIIPSSVTFIGKNAFDSTNISSLEFDAQKSCLVIDDEAFIGCWFSSVVLPVGTQFIDWPWNDNVDISYKIPLDPNSPLFNEIQRLQNIGIIRIETKVTEEDLKKINKSNIIDIVATQLNLNKEKFDYQAIDFINNSYSITFRIMVSDKGTNEYYHVKKIYVDFVNIQHTPISGVTIEGLKR